MSDPLPRRFLDFLAIHNQAGEVENEALRHEMSATLNRNRLTGQEEGLHAFNTNQLCWMVTGNPLWPSDHFLVQALLLSSLIDDRMAIFREAQACGVVPASWTWVGWADDFAGNEAELRPRLGSVEDFREKCGAVCLATAKRPDGIGLELLQEFRQPTLAVVYHRLLTRAMAGPHAAAIADVEIGRLCGSLEVLFAADTDATIAAMIQACSLDFPELLIAGIREATGDFTRTAIARRHLERGRAAEALAMIKDLRFLSPAYDRAIVIAALAALEIGNLELAGTYTDNIVERDLGLKIRTRIAQASGDIDAEVEALVDLYELHPTDAQVFVQLINVLERLPRHDLVRDLCYRAQESFCDDAYVAALVKRHLAVAQ